MGPVSDTPTVEEMVEAVERASVLRHDQRNLTERDILNCVIATLRKHEAMRAALEDIIDANQRFRDSLPEDWDGDPLNDACEKAKHLLAPTPIKKPARQCVVCGSPWVDGRNGCDTCHSDAAYAWVRAVRGAPWRSYLWQAQPRPGRALSPSCGRLPPASRSEVYEPRPPQRPAGGPMTDAIEKAGGERYWRHRVIEFVDPEVGPWRAIHEVYFIDGRPIMYAENPAAVTTEGESNEGLAWLLDRMREALGRPVLVERDFESAARLADEGRGE